MIPAWLVLLAGVAFNAFVFVLAITTIDRAWRTQPPGNAPAYDRQ
jgi:hypothetical protein